MDRIFFENTTAAIGISTDPVNNHETIVLGEPEEIRQFFRNNTPYDTELPDILRISTV